MQWQRERVRALRNRRAQGQRGGGGVEGRPAGRWWPKTGRESERLGGKEGEGGGALVVWEWRGVGTRAKLTDWRDEE